MLKILKSSLILGVLLTGCSAVKESTLVKKKHTQEKIKEDFYSLEDYKNPSIKKTNLHELNYSEYELNLFSKKFKEIKSSAEELIVLDHSYTDILDVMTDKQYIKKFGNPIHFGVLVYDKNRMMPIIWSGEGTCVGGTKYFMELIDNQLKIKTINEVVYSLASPVEME